MKKRSDPDEVVRRLEELLTIWKAPSGKTEGGYDIIERLIALRNREVATVAAALERVRYTERQRDEALRHLGDVLNDDLGAETAARKLLAYYR